MPDWYVKRNNVDSPYPYAVRLGGCEYSLTEEDFDELATAFCRVLEAVKTPMCIESDDYQDLVIASSTDKRSLDDIMKLPKPNTDPIRRF
jgi:hypothetical protein